MIRFQNYIKSLGQLFTTGKHFADHSSFNSDDLEHKNYYFAVHGFRLMQGYRILLKYLSKTKSELEGNTHDPSRVKVDCNKILVT